MKNVASVFAEVTGSQDTKKHWRRGFLNRNRTSEMLLIHLFRTLQHFALTDVGQYFLQSPDFGVTRSSYTSLMLLLTENRKKHDDTLSVSRGFRVCVCVWTGEKKKHIHTCAHIHTKTHTHTCQKWVNIHHVLGGMHRSSSAADNDRWWRL